MKPSKLACGDNSLSIGDEILPPSRVNNREGLEKVERLLVPVGHPGAYATWLGMLSPNPMEYEMVIFVSFIMASLLPPFSTFFIAVLEFYGIHLLHLSTNFVLVLAIFAYLCEMSIGVMPYIVLFHEYFSLLCRVEPT